MVVFLCHCGPLWDNRFSLGVCASRIFTPRPGRADQQVAKFGMAKGAHRALCEKSAVFYHR